MGILNINMPSLGEGIIEASVIKLLKSVGDSVEQDDALVEIATDKVDSEIIAPESGIIKSINVKSGDIVKVGDIVVVLESGEKSGDKSPIQETIGHSESPKRAFLSPLIKKIMKEEELSYNEVSSLSGSGYLGRITRDDVMKYLKYKKEGGLHAKDIKEIPEASVISKGEHELKKEIDSTISKGNKDFSYDSERGKLDTTSNKLSKSSIPKELSSESSAADYIEVEMDRVRKLIASHTLESAQTAPHVTSFIEVDISNFKKIKDENKLRFIDEYGIRLTYTSLFIAATVKALEKFPEINSSLVGDKIRYHKHINIGIATALDNGNLIVPVIKNTENQSIRGIAQQLKELTNKARSNKLDPTDISGGTFSISNYGSYSTMAGTPIIVQPQSAILGIGEIIKRVVVIEEEHGDSIGIRPRCILSLSFDHRIIDGALAGNFMGYLKESIENLKFP